MDARAIAEALTHELARKGMIIEAGWQAVRLAWIHPDAPPEQLKQLRWAYMAGAYHLFTSLMITMDSDGEPTQEDIRKLELIGEELENFKREMEALLPTEGRA